MRYFAALQLGQKFFSAFRVTEKMQVTRKIMVRAEILHFVQDGTPECVAVKAETLRCAQSDGRVVVLERRFPFLSS